MLPSLCKQCEQTGKSICLKDELIFLRLCLSTMHHQAIEHSQYMRWWPITMVLKWLGCHVSTTGLGVISSGPWELSHNDNIRLVCLSLGSECLATHFMGKGHGSILYTLQVVVITLCSLDILCWMGRNNRCFEIPLVTTRVILRPPLLCLRELMNYAGTIHMTTPDHDSIIAPVIWTKTFSVSNLLQKAPWQKTPPQALCLSCHGSIVPK